MKLVLPKQHGAWAKILIPFLLEVIISGGRVITHSVIRRLSVNILIY